MIQRINELLTDNFLKSQSNMRASKKIVAMLCKEVREMKSDGDYKWNQTRNKAIADVVRLLKGS